PGDIIPEWWARSSRNGGRHQIGTVGEIIPEWWATSSGISSVASGFVNLVGVLNQTAIFSSFNLGGRNAGNHPTHASFSLA
ncbi:hypothetical protein L6654_16795, partial [Bradyrhizobium sp. WYCCWR 13023]